MRKKVTYNDNKTQEMNDCRFIQNDLVRKKYENSRNELSQGYISYQPSAHVEEEYLS